MGWWFSCFRDFRGFVVPFVAEKIIVWNSRFSCPIAHLTRPIAHIFTVHIFFDLWCFFLSWNHSYFSWIFMYVCNRSDKWNSKLFSHVFFTQVRKFMSTSCVSQITKRSYLHIGYCPQKVKDCRHSGKATSWYIYIYPASEVPALVEFGP